MTEDEMVGWHPQLNGHGLEQTWGGREGQGSPASCTRHKFLSHGSQRAEHDLATEQEQ